MTYEVKSRFSGAVLISGKGDLRAANLSSADLRAANLYCADLRGADLRGADLYCADLRRADLRAADLYCANLRAANLYCANLRGADLRGADLRAADLSSADLRAANLYCADLRGADLRGADLRGADLSSADLRDAKDAELVIAQTRILAEGDLIGWKKCSDDVIVKLRIPAEAKRSHAFGRKCRAEYVDVLEVIGAEVAYSVHDNGRTEYRAGARVVPDSFDPDWTNECAPGIHFFITRAEAEAY
jgi:hypothetical protein